MPDSLPLDVPFYSMAHIFAVARNAAFHISDDVDWLDPAQEQSLTAIVFSAVALEAFFNELYELADFRSTVRQLGRDKQPEITPYQLPEAARVWHQLLPSLDRTRDEIKAKLVLTCWIFTGKSLDMGAEWTQDFARLLQLRNSLVHVKPVRGHWEPSRSEIVLGSDDPLRKFLESKKLISSTRQYGRWVSDVTTMAVATWACDTARNSVGMILGILPERSTFRSEAEAAFALPPRLSADSVRPARRERPRWP